MTREEMIIWLCEAPQWSSTSADIAAQLDADGETIARLEAAFIKGEAISISALAEEGRKRGEAEARIAELETAIPDAVLLLQDAASGFVHEGTSDMAWRAKRDQVVADLCLARAALRPADKGDAP